jgi:DNA-binding response OmpR family regulator
MVVSGIANEQSIASWLRVGANAYLQKPLNVSALLTGIKQLIVNVRNVAA